MSSEAATHLTIDAVALGRVQQELGVQASNIIMLQVQIERLTATIADNLALIAALTDRARQAEARLSALAPSPPPT